MDLLRATIPAKSPVFSPSSSSNQPTPRPLPPPHSRLQAHPTRTPPRPPPPLALTPKPNLNANHQLTPPSPNSPSPAIVASPSAQCTPANQATTTSSPRSRPPLHRCSSRISGTTGRSTVGQTPLETFPHINPEPYHLPLPRATPTEPLFTHMPILCTCRARNKEMMDWHMVMEL